MFEHVVDLDDLADLKAEPGEILAPVDEAMFGAINANVLSYENFEEDYEALGLTGLRFPGGSLAENDRAENGEWLYDPVAYETGFHPSHDMSNRASLDDMIAMAAEQDVTLSITVPVERFFDDPSAAYDYMADLLERLAAVEDAPPITLDLGNEPYSDPAAYGAVLAEMLSALRDARDGGLEGVTVGIQVMQDAYGYETNNQILVDTIGADDPSLLAEIDAVRMHALDLPTRNAAQYEDVRHELPELIMEAIVAEGGDPELHVSAWAVRGDDALPEDWDGAASAPLASSGALLSLFASMLELGAVRADAWGLAVSDANRTALSYTGAEGERVYAPHAVTLGLMAESIVGLNLVDDGRLDIGANGPIVQTYVGEDLTVVFLSAGDIDGELDVSITLDGLGEVTGAWADRVALIEGDHAGAAEAVREPVTITEDGRLLWTFEEDFETVRIVISGYEGANGGRHLFGSAEADLLQGTAGDDLIEGSGGDDILMGGAGTDMIDGGTGHDAVSYEDHGGGVVIHLGKGTATGSGLEHALVSIEEAHGSRGADVLYAADGGSVLDGGGGDDTVLGREGDDDLWGGGGRDVMRGNDGDDRMRGGGGGDVIRGGTGDDLMTGGGGADRFVLEAGHGRDRITDFDLGADSIKLNGLGIEDMSGLSIREGSRGAIVDTGEGTVTLIDVDAAALDEGHFIF